MLSHDVLSGNFVVLPPTGFLVPQAEKPGSPSQNNRKKGLEGEAKVLGTIQIFSSIMVTSLGLLVACTAIPHYFSSLIATLLKSGYPFFSLSGLLVVIVAKTAEKRLTWAGLAANLLSLVAASVGLVVLIVNMAEVLAAWGLCELNAVSKMPTQDVDYSGYYSSGAGPHRCALSGSSLLVSASERELQTRGACDRGLGLARASSWAWGSGGGSRRGRGTGRERTTCKPAFTYQSSSPTTGTRKPFGVSFHISECFGNVSFIQVLTFLPASETKLLPNITCA
ncbi:membrane-spanning 4-domains subfamily A member 7-like isoform X2 [Pteropus medius]|uniref:membrane-spanning 4-domains subfamily A member 7-like isoform X2 n=1 Tax=Pteropus vampyrus TaxID=132908 RepID=UPI00196B4EC6|nr:membrane-spanning 4-domains subfamily A member 7-like isoform X2 [Pteropus giganteus]